MKARVTIDARLQGGSEVILHCRASADEVRKYGGHDGRIAELWLERAFEETVGIPAQVREVASWGIAIEDPPDIQRAGYRAGSEDVQISRLVRKVGRCRSLLTIAKGVLPPDTRDDALDEWMDEIECAVEANHRVTGRLLSILFRALPAVAWRSRRPAWARRGGG